MSVLAKKLWRAIAGTKGQFLAVVAVVAVGISVYISMSTAFFNLQRSQESFYRENNFADYYFHVVKAPQEITRQIELVSGVAAVTGRIQKDVPVIKENNQRATARLISYPVPINNAVNRLRLLTGRLFEKYPQSGGVEILLDPQYAQANDLSFPDTVNIVAEGRQVSLAVVGTGLSPEFIYPIKDAASVMPEPDNFGIIMIPTNQVQEILNLNGQINEVVIKLAPGAREEKVAEQVKEILKPYGNLAGYPRKQQMSHAVLQGELDQLLNISRILPVIFLAVAAAIQFIMIGRMVRAQRMQIGIMKALGYNNREIMLHYTGYALLVALTGAVLGLVLGLFIASAMSQEYAKYFNLPEVIGGVNTKAIIYGFILSLGVGAVAGLGASRGVAAVNPAESMRPEPPRRTGKFFLERWPWLWRKFSSSWKMSLRTIGRNRMRFGVTLLGCVFAVSMLVISIFINDTIDYMFKKHFYEEQQYNYLVRFEAPVKESELFGISRLGGVLKAEPLLEIPVRMRFQGRSEDDVLLGLPPGGTLKKLAGAAEEPLRLPEEGILINERTAAKLGVRVGDRVEVETLLGLGPTHKTSLTVAGMSRQLIGGGSYINLEQANAILRETRLVSGVMLKVDPGQGYLVEEELNKMTGVSSVLSRQKEFDSFNQNLGSMIFFTATMIIFAVILGFAIIYNSSIISFVERRRELASLRVIGLTTQEVKGFLFKENILQIFIGVAFGLPFGRFLAQEYITAASTDFFSFPVVIYPLTYFYSALGGVFFILAAHFFVSKGVEKLDLVEVLKNRD